MLYNIIISGRAVSVILIHSVNFKPENDQSSIDIFTAIKEGNYDMVNYIIEQNPNELEQIDRDKRTPLHYSKIYKHDDIYDLLIKKRLDPNILDAFMFKASDYPIEKPEKYEDNPVKAVENNDINSLKYHYTQDINIVSKEDSDQRILLHYAHKYGHKKIIEFLEKRSSKEHKDKYGMTPEEFGQISDFEPDLIKAIRNNHPKSVKYHVKWKVIFMVEFLSILHILLEVKQLLIS